MKYKVINHYGISGVSIHRKVEAALKAAARREGEGWIVVDDEGNQWDWNGSQPAISRAAEDGEAPAATSRTNRPKTPWSRNRW